MTKCPDSFIYFNVRKCALFGKGAECLKPAQKALFVQNLVAHGDASSIELQKLCATIKISPRSLFSFLIACRLLPKNLD